jgi:BioD-like phosphotransacetylase family protein
MSVASTNPFELPELPLLSAPTNRQTKRLFVAATRMNDGKTTTCLGLFAALQSVFPRVGFIKPIGQRFVEVQGHQVDEDSVLLDTIYKVHVPIESMSPVAIDGTFTRRYLKEPADTLPKLEDNICRAFDRVSWEKDFTLIEGTGHAGVGSVFDLSNARVAQLLNSKAVIVCPGGIGRPIDEIALNKALFDQVGVEVVGAIINKVEPDKADSIRDYVGCGLERLGVPLLGLLPVQKVLASPNLLQIAAEIKAEWVQAPTDGQSVRVSHLVVGAMTAKGIVDHLKPGTVIITPGDRDDILLAAVSSAQNSPQDRVAGVILTNGIKPNQKLLQLLEQAQIPAMMTRGESYTVTSKINSMTVKTQPNDSDKIPVIKSLVQNNVDMAALMAAI